MKKNILLASISFLLVGMIFSQEEKTSNGLEFLPSIGVHVGALSYMGDIKGVDGANIYTYWKPAYGFYLEKK